MNAKVGSRKPVVKKRARHIIPGIVADARALGVSRVHLWKVLNGRRQSEGLVARYQRLQASK